jgi:hypothetical protein
MARDLSKIINSLDIDVIAWQGSRLRSTMDVRLLLDMRLISSIQTLYNLVLSLQSTKWPYDMAKGFVMFVPLF